MVPNYRLLLHHELNELVVVNAAIAILISLADHFVDLIVSELLADGSHDMAKLGSGNEAVVVTVEDLDALAVWTPCWLGLQRTLNASRISSSESVSFIFLAIMVKNSVRSWC